jgi:hypothetical protein
MADKLVTVQLLILKTFATFTFPNLNALKQPT